LVAAAEEAIWLAQHATRVGVGKREVGQRHDGLPPVGDHRLRLASDRNVVALERHRAECALAKVIGDVAAVSARVART
jgi:hypothetical protein